MWPSICRCVALVTVIVVGAAPGPYGGIFRPQLHYSPKVGRMSDPGGMVYFEGEYHLFYQYYPDTTVGGAVHWGQAISTDLLHWENLPTALYPDSLGIIFSGSVIVDRNNSSGLGQDGKPPLVAIFAHDDMDVESPSIVYSTDKGRNWTKYEGNPVLPGDDNVRDFRDPKVTWDEDSGQWVMALAAHDRILFYGSPDLRTWGKLSEFGPGLGSHKGVWEHPDLFPLTDNQTGEQKWVLLVSVSEGAPNGGSGTQYFVGEFDGTHFFIDPVFRDRVTADRGRWIDYGRDNHAGVTLNDIPQEDGRRIFIGWMSNSDYARVVPARTGKSAMTLPRELTLRQTPGGYALRTEPLRGLTALRGEPANFVTAPARAGTSSALTAEITMSVHFKTNDHFGIELYNEIGEVLRVGLIGNRNAYYCDRSGAGGGSLTYAPREKGAPLTNFRLVVDATSIELFADDGDVVLTETFSPTAPFTGMRTYGLEDGSVMVMSSELYPLESIWLPTKR